MTIFPEQVRTVYFDAVGTILFPDPPVALAYHQAGQRYGSRRSLDEVRRAFSAAFAAEERRDRESGNRTDSRREWDRWQRIVQATFPDVSGLEGECLFDDLWNHFALSTNWRVAPEADRLLSGLKQRGLQVGIASNFDRRLVTIVSELPVLNHSSVVVRYSEEIGWRKPAPEFFAALCAGEPPHQVMLVGDDRTNDYDGARAAGLHAILLDDHLTLRDLLP